MHSRKVRLFLLSVVTLFLTCPAWAQDSGSSAPKGQNPSDSSASQQQPPSESKDNESKDKKKKKKDKKDKTSQDDVNTEVFSTAVANNVLNDIRDGLEGHTQRLMLSAFDADKMDGYLEFEDQIQAFFNRYDSFRVYFRVVQSATEGAKGVILVDFQLEEIPRGGTAAPARKSGQIRFELERGCRGWKIVDFTPRNFFS